MRILTCTFFFTLAIFLNSIELSSQSFPRRQQPPPPLPNIYFYKAGDGVLKELHGHVRPGLLSNFIIGIVDDGVLRKIYDHDREMVVVRRENMFNVPLDEEHSLIFPYDQLLPADGVIAAPFTYHFQ